MVNETRDTAYDITWVDVMSPSDQEVQELSAKYNIDAFLIKDSMNPEHFPRFDVVNDKVRFLILRLYDDSATREADTVRELTRKVAIFYGPNFLITIHRREISWLNALKENASNYLCKKNAVEAIVTKIIQETISKYEQPIQTATRCLEEFEVKVFRDQKTRSLFEDLYFTRRKAVVFKEMIDLTTVLLTDQLFVLQGGSRNNSILKRLKSETERLYFYSNKLYESVSYLINLHISLSSHRTNEVMRVLTVFSAFFLPLTFIVGVYGMNFENMPELKSTYGYYTVMVFMLVLCVGIFYWFRKKGWLKFE